MSSRDDAFATWLATHPEASRRDAWDAAVRACVRVLSVACATPEVPRLCQGEPGVLWKLHSTRHRPFSMGGRT